MCTLKVQNRAYSLKTCIRWMYKIVYIHWKMYMLNIQNYVHSLKNYICCRYKIMFILWKIVYTFFKNMYVKFTKLYNFFEKLYSLNNFELGTFLEKLYTSNVLSSVHSLKKIVHWVIWVYPIVYIHWKMCSLNIYNFVHSLKNCVP